MGWYTRRPSSHGLATPPRQLPYFYPGIVLIIPLFQGYLPLPTSLRPITLKRKRGEYQNMVELAFARGREGLDQQIWHQIEIDVPRTRPGVRLWMHEATQRVCYALIFFGLFLSEMAELRAHSLCLGHSSSC